jgi:hypothetical protein
MQAEAEEEFRKRFGVVNARPPSMQGWRPYLGQSQPQAIFPAAGAAPAPASKPYVDQVKERLLWFGAGSLFGFPIGILSNVAFKSLRRYRHEAATFAAIATGVGLLSAVLPIDSPIMPMISRISGILAGGAASDIVLPKQPVLIPA